jgi:flavin reductase (DIM6/NTAB) family NADH-FMN oxidoreductase RutF
VGWRAGDLAGRPDPNVAPGSSISNSRFRAALGHFCSGVTVVASVVDASPVGLTCQSFFSVSLEPPLVALSVSKASTSFPAIRAAGLFSVNILTRRQWAIGEALATTATGKWAGVEWRAGRFGQPVLAGSLAWLECELLAVHDAGDHHLVVATVLDLDCDGREQPLLYFRSEYRELAVTDVAAC